MISFLNLLFLASLCVAAEKVTLNSQYVTLTSLNLKAFPGRDAHSAVIINNKLIIVAGEDANRQALHDVWISSPPDSGIFYPVNVTKGFPPRADHSTVVIGNKIIIMAGQFNKTVTYNDVWSSTDLGVSWTQETSSAPWSGRIGAMAVVLNTDILLIGGYASTSTPPVHTSEIWKSTDHGKTWILLANNTFPGRADAQVNVLANNVLIMTGGENVPPNTFSDVLRSTDGGLTWKTINAAAPFGNRFQHTTAVIGDQLVLTAGLKTNFSYWYNDLWASRDQGVTWQLITSNAGFTGRAHTDGNVWIDSANHYNFILTGGTHGGGSQVYLAHGLPFIITNAATRYIMNWGGVFIVAIAIIWNVC